MSSQRWDPYPSIVKESMVGIRVVLVVEDEDDLRDLEQSLVEDLLGLKTLVAADGRQALKLAREQLPALILLDVMLPEMNGLEVARRLKANTMTKNIPIIAVTAATTREQAMEAGCNDYIAKPFDVGQFMGKVQQHLPPMAPLASC